MAIVPYLAYADAPAAIEFLCGALGFELEFRHDTPEGFVGHAELRLEGSSLRLSSAWPEAGFLSPLALDGVHCQVWCDIADVDAHYERALQAGAVVIGPPSDQVFGYRTYRVIDPEGHRWDFGTHIG